MTDIIRQAVELADGWDHDIEKDGSPVFYYENQNGYWYFSHPPQPALDALAAQLVRQVDAIDYGITFNTDNECKTAVWGSRGYTPYVISSSFGPDRTLNTITAIVESKVLE